MCCGDGNRSRGIDYLHVPNLRPGKGVEDLPHERAGKRLPSDLLDTLVLRRPAVAVSVAIGPICRTAGLRRKRLDLQGRLPPEKLPAVFGKRGFPPDDVVEEKIALLEADPQTPRFAAEAPSRFDFRAEGRVLPLHELPVSLPVLFRDSAAARSGAAAVGGKLFRRDGRGRRRDFGNAARRRTIWTSRRGRLADATGGRPCGATGGGNASSRPEMCRHFTVHRIGRSSFFPGTRFCRYF